jgi:hypothetical protein
VTDRNGEAHGPPNRAERRKRFGTEASKLPKAALLVTRMPGYPFVFIGLDSYGYVELDLDEARAIAEELHRLSDPAYRANG